MTSISRINFTGNLLANHQQTQIKAPAQEVQEAPKENIEAQAVAVENKDNNNDKKVKEKIVYVSNNPDRAVAATGVVAGTSGMIGGSVLGGVVGVSKLPGEYIKTIAGQNYAKIVGDSVEGFKTALKQSPELMQFVNTIKNSNSPAVAEEILHIAGTMSERLHGAFANDPHAAAVIDKVIDPIVKGVSVKKNFRNYGSGLRGQVKSPLGQTIMKFLGFNKKTSKIVKGVTGNLAEGFTQAIENIRNFTPEEKQAWSKVAKQMFNEFEHNPKIKASADMLKAIGGLSKDSKWFTEPFKAMQENIIKGVKNLDKGLAMSPVKTIGKWAGIGAIGGAALSLLGWGLMKTGLMKKETAKTEAVQA